MPGRGLPTAGAWLVFGSPRVGGRRCRFACSCSASPLLAGLGGSSQAAAPRLRAGDAARLAAAAVDHGGPQPTPRATPNVVDIIWYVNERCGLQRVLASLLAPNLVLTARHCVANVLNTVQGGIDCSPVSGFSKAGRAPATSTCRPSGILNLTQDFPAGFLHASRRCSRRRCRALPVLRSGSVRSYILSRQRDHRARPRRSSRASTVPDRDPARPYSAIGFGNTNASARDDGTRRKRRRPQRQVRWQQLLGQGRQPDQQPARVGRRPRHLRGRLRGPGPRLHQPGLRRHLARRGGLLGQLDLRPRLLLGRPGSNRPHAPRRAARRLRPRRPGRTASPPIRSTATSRRRRLRERRHPPL